MITRRGFVQLLGAGMAACSSRSARELIPYADSPERSPGRPTFYASALVEDGFARGVIVETHEGRPTKLEGNPKHPASLGATRAIEQAAVLDLYAPDRLQAPSDRGVPASWHAVTEQLRGPLHLVLPPTTSPATAALVSRLRARGDQVTFWAPFEPRNSLEGNRLAFGRPLQTQLALEDADVIVSLDADLVAEHPMSVAYARRIADRRRVVDKHSAMSRIYAIESTYTRLGLLADHRFKATPAEIAGYATSLSGSPTGWLAAIARDLERAGARGVIVAGEHLPPEVHAICAQLNARSQVVRYTEPVAFEAGTASHSLDGVRAALLRGEVGTLVVVGYEPINLPVGSATQALFIGSHPPRETYHLTAPLLHALESWDVARAYDGTPTPIQPMIEPLVDGKAIDDVLHDFLGDPPEDRRDRAERAWAQLSTTPFDEALVRGVGTGSTPVVHGPIQAVSFTAKTAPLELVVRPHPFLHDGRYATNPWLRELPDPITKLSWDNAAQLSPATMRRLGLTNGELVLVDGTAIVPVIAVPGHADNVVTLFGDHGLRTGPVTVASTGEATELAITQPHGDMEGRPIALTGELASLAPEAYAEHRETHPSLISRDPPKGPQWAMHIDLTTCSGCTACVMACASENNTPVVGKQHVIERREMHWLRLDRYVDGEDVRVQPMACQHCENAPCEYVCPTAATTHSPDGLNEMTYNRCVGTRFCSNNCPYKVRRFNWFDFQERKGLRVYGKNPDVTVRDRGVMEKCTYCVQRIRRAEIDTRVDGKPLTVQTACQQACPTQAITFGTLDDVKELRARPHAYAVLDDQGTIPRTRYLARVRNRNPEIS